MLRTVLSFLINFQLTIWACLVFSGHCQASSTHQAIILQYHHVSDTTPPSTSVSPEKFIEHLALIDQLGFQVLPLPIILQHIQQGSSFSRKTLGISFDDGYLSIYQQAFPELKKRNLPFTIFVSPQAIDKQHGNSLSWLQLQEMQKHGATIANHSLNHDHLLARQNNEALSEWKTRITQNINQAQLRLGSELNTFEKLFAYPYGEFNHALQSLLDEQGYIAFSQQSGPISSSSHLQALPRFPASGVYANLETLSIKLKSLAFNIIKESPKSEVLLLGQPAPELDLTLLAKDLNHQHLQCFYQGQRIFTQVTQQEDQLKVTARHSSPLKEGRSRYNCTCPSLSQNRYYWYSMPFVVPNEQGEIK